MLTEKEVRRLREELATTQRPIFFFNDDPDGFASFLLLYRMIREGKGFVVKATPKLGIQFAQKALEYVADKVFVLDIAIVEQEFIDAVKMPVVWIDHHPPLLRERVAYFNPKTRGASPTPTSYLCWQVSQKDSWIALAGTISDWYLPENGLVSSFRKEYPSLLPKEIKNPEEALFNSPVGVLAKVLSFNLKGSSQDVNTSIKVFTRLAHPDEILKQESPAGKLIWKKYQQVNQVYESLLRDALREEKKNKEEKFLLFSYSKEKISLTKDLANELAYRFPEKLVIVCREKGDEMKCSFRYSRGNLLKALETALVGIEGYGGGHEFACGGVIKSHNFKRFIENLRAELGV